MKYTKECRIIPENFVVCTMKYYMICITHNIVCVTK